jgi:FAD/FMN-containing dehydrogenase
LSIIIREGGRRAEIYAGLKSIADRYGDQVRRQFPNIPRRVSGYNLNHLLPENGFHVARALVGSEGTCVTILEATCRLVESPPARVLLVIAYGPTFIICADHVPKSWSTSPIGLEGFDDFWSNATRAQGRQPRRPRAAARRRQDGSWSSSAPNRAEAESQARNLMQALGRAPIPPNMRLFTDPRQAKRIWDVRESSLGVTSHVPGEPLRWEGFEDAAVAPEKLGAYLRDLRKMMQAHGYEGSLLRPLRPRLRAHPHGLRSANRKKASRKFRSSWKRPPTS